MKSEDCLFLLPGTWKSDWVVRILFLPGKRITVNWEVTYVWWWYITFLRHVLAEASYTAGKHPQIADVETETLRIKVRGITLTKIMLEQSCPDYPAIQLGTSRSTDPRMVGNCGEERSPLKWSADISASSRPSQIPALGVSRDVQAEAAAPRWVSPGKPGALVEHCDRCRSPSRH